MDKFIFLASCFIAVSVLASLPRFLFEVQSPFLIVDRMLLLALFLGLTWFFRTSLHAKFNPNVLSSLFMIETIAAVVFAVLLFLQFFSAFFAIVAGIVLIAKLGVYAYLSIDRLSNMRGLVYTTTFAVLLIGEVVLTFGITYI